MLVTGTAFPDDLVLSDREFTTLVRKVAAYRAKHIPFTTYEKQVVEVGNALLASGVCSPWCLENIPREIVAAEAS
jgi:hypothetical protein